MNEADRRRVDPRQRHALSIHLIADRLVPLCRCGKIVGGRRTRDVKVLTLTDILELVRIHSNEVNYPR